MKNIKKNKKNQDTTKNKICQFTLLMVLGGIFGFIYEELFYFIDLGMWVKRGTSIGPWVPIYGFGAILLVLINQKTKHKPWVVFIHSVLLTGLLELVSGYILLHIFNTRLWDYNTEIWNWGNIGGYICLRSLLFFGLSALLLVYAVYPLLENFTKKIGNKKLYILSTILGIIYICDISVSFLLKFF